MYCTKCGAQIPEDCAFCPKCGAPIAREVSSGNASKNPQPNNYAYQRSTDNHNSSPNNYDATNQMPKMKWYKTLIYCILFLNIAGDIIGAISVGFGFSYGDAKQDIYRYYPIMQALDIIYCLCGLAMAVFAFWVRQQLAHYKQNAPKLFVIYIACTGLLSLIYTLLLYIIIGAFSGYVVLYIVLYLVVYAVYIILNLIYFNKRAYLFIN